MPVAQALALILTESNTDMTTEPKRWLTNSLRSRLIPEFERRGFNVVPLTGDDARSGEIRAAFPFGRLRRPGPNGLEMVEIQLDKHGRAAFRLNIGVAPSGGIAHAVGQVAQEDIWVHYLSRYYEVYRWPLARRWFSVWRWPGSSATQADYDALVKRVVDLIPEVEEVLTSGGRGPHIRLIGA
ncbi:MULTISPECIES: hypothetical protein [Ralstonia solanacearum species complex]|uniref:hypothetical protein n=1 Tax=Ralstonia solanacearum species complex TaxID=3116862 RepID=UPI0011124411|nr:hypothetical protein [Ralstonia solanacearum]NUU72698.1 hypothetical protein [Ralstonia solanacearum]QHB60984.1 hypothetical protein GRD98_18465 [Ralstonia solanacearum]